MNESALLEAPAPVAGSASRPDLADLILLRLLPEKKSVAPKKLRTDLAVFFSRPLADSQVSPAVTALRAEGFITPKGQKVTDAGRARALQFLGVAKFPPRTNWRAIKDRYLVPKALGLAPEAKEAREGKRLAALLLKRTLGLPVGTGASLSAVFEAIACQVLGFRDHATLKELIPLLLAKKVGSDSPVSKREAGKVVPHVLLKANRKGVEGLRAVALGRWAVGESPPAEGPEAATVDEPFDLEMFANTVKAVARKCPTGRFGDNKVFISHVWNELRAEPRFAALGLDGFKQKLVEANRENLLTLSRADLVQLMDPADVRESETTYLTATFHFILVEKD